MKKVSNIRWTYLAFGVILGLLLITLQAVEYRAMIKDVSLEIYGGIIALIFISIGTWIGISFFSQKNHAPSSVMAETGPDPTAIADSGLSERELDVLKLMAQGHSNKEIAKELFVSQNTVKTHASNIYFKLGVKRRTQAVKKAKDRKII